MATILEMVTVRREEFKKDPTRATQSMGLAISALKEGIKSKAWEYYMSQFIDKSDSDLSAAQLARLKATDETEGDPVMDRHRAYLVTNAICGPSTVTTITNGILSIDDRLGTAQCVHMFLECDKTTIGLATPETRGRAKATKSKKAAKR